MHSAPRLSNGEAVVIVIIIIIEVPGVVVGVSLIMTRGRDVEM